MSEDRQVLYVSTQSLLNTFYSSLVTLSGNYLSLLIVSNLHERFLYLCCNILGVWSVTDHPAVIRVLYGLPTDRTRLVVDIPLLYAGHTVGVGAGKDQIWLPLYTDTTLLH